MYNVSFPGLGIENISVNPILLKIGDFSVNWYGAIIAIGMCLAVLYTMNNCERYNINKDKLLDCILVGIVTAIIGARLYYVIFEWDVYSKDLLSIFKIHEGGLAIYGGVIGGLIGGLIIAKRSKLNKLGLLDLASLGLLIGQGIGRWGNFMNQEAFGTPTDLPWGMISENTGGVTVHPCFLYESLACLIGFLLLHIFSKKFQKYDGQIFLLYLVWYGTERAIVEGLRTDSLYTPFLNLRVSQILSIGLVIVSLVILIINFVKKRDVMAVPINRIKHENKS